MKQFVLFLLCITNGLAQNKVKTDCNTIYICIDSASCKAIFSNAYVKDKLFVCGSNSTTTDNDSYSGNYLIGKSATIEFLQPQKGDKNGDKVGEFGIEFKTRQIGDLNAIFEQSTKKKIQLDTITSKLITQDTVVPWYKELTFKEKNFELNLLEYRKEYLNFLGFSEAEIENEMTYEQYNMHRSGGKKYPKQFNKIKSISIVLSKNEAQSLKQFCELNQMKKGKHYFYNNDLKIRYTITNNNSPALLKEINFELIESQQHQKMQLSKTVTLEVSGTKGRFIFNK